MTKYNHAYTVAFALESYKEDGSDVTPMMLAVALNRRIAQLLEDDEIEEATGCPFDTYEVENTCCSLASSTRGFEHQTECKNYVIKY